MEMINEYTLMGELKTTNSGFSKWGFAQKNDKKYFIKEFIDPIWPVYQDMLDPVLVQRKKQICETYEARSKLLYRSINECSDGNIVFIEDFFRCGSHYYLVMEKVDNIDRKKLNITDLKDRERLCRVLLHSVGCLHKKGIVHADIKMDNILFRQLPSGKITGKLIDFDNCFWEKTPPAPDEEIHADLVYMAPETFMMMQTETGSIDRKIDVFALGIIFHEILAGKLPSFDTNRYDYPFEAVLGGDSLIISSDIPDPWNRIIDRMLKGNPDKRISIEEIDAVLSERKIEKPEENKNIPRFFMAGGDL